MAETFRISRVTWEKHGAHLSAVRLTVFVDEQKFAPEPLDDRDPDCLHVAALDQKGATIGTGRMTPDGHIGRMAVLPPWRGRGVGTAVLHELLAIAKERPPAAGRSRRADPRHPVLRAPRLCEGW